MLRSSLLALVTTMAACAPQKPVAVAPNASTRFATLVDEVFAKKFAFRPTSATAMGLHEHDGRFEDWSATSFSARVEELRGEIEALSRIPRDSLSFDEQIDADALDGVLHAELYDIDEQQEWRRNPMWYAALPGRSLHGLMKRDYAPKAERVAAMTRRLEQLPAHWAAARKNLVDPPRVFTEISLRGGKGFVKFLEGPVKTWAGDAPASFTKAHAAAVEGAKAFVTWLETDLLPRSHGDFAIGPTRFMHKLKWDERIEIGLPELLARGEAQLAKDHAAFVETAKLISPDKSAGEVMKDMESQHPTSEQLVGAVAASLDEARRFLVEKDLVTLPSEVGPKVEETPPFARAQGFAFMDTPGPFETHATEAYYYVTPPESEWTPEHKEEHLRLFNVPTIAVITVHEAWPGHYLQFLWAPRLPTKTRKLVSAGSNSEGWAHYVEQMMIEQGFSGASPKLRLAQLAEALVRDCRYVVGVKLHTRGMTVEEGARVFVEQAFMQPANAMEEARRGTFNPTYLYYTLGKLEIQALATEWMAKHPGAKLKQFHDAFVRAGALPIPIVRRLLSRT